MRTYSNDRLIEFLIPSLVRREVLCRLLLEDRDWHPRELSRQSGLSNSAVALELKQLTSHGLAGMRKVGNQARYRANRDSPLYPVLREMLTLTAGVADRVRSALAGLVQRGEIESAFVFGSYARGDFQDGSDLDLMLVGTLNTEDALAALEPVERDLRREVNPVIYPQHEYLRELDRGEGFIHHVHHGPKILLVGKLLES